MRPLRTLCVTAALAVATTLAVPVVAGGMLATPAAAENKLTPGNFTGFGFDQCVAPTQGAMNAWLQHSPFLAVGIYISGDSRGCRSQPNLTPRWITTQLNKGWRLLPITLGPQASCHPSFPRYGDDEVIDDDPGPRGGYRDARLQGRREASRTIAAARALGLRVGSTLWYDLEGFDHTRTRCRSSALAFLSGWTTRLQARGWVSGVYSSAGSGIVMLDDARRARRSDVRLPDYLWIARWDGVANTSTSYISDAGWNPHRRVKQYLGGHPETWGGVTINIDRNYLDVGRGSFAPRERHCGGIRVSFGIYPWLETGSPHVRQVRALQCLLRERGFFRGQVTGVFGPETMAAVHAWERRRGFRESTRFRTGHWMALVTHGRTGVRKLGSAGPLVSRVQRALNAASPRTVRVTGVFDRATDQAVRAWQRRAGLRPSGVMNAASWTALQSGRR